jgi:tetratricopeptide (TPR) repeat protein
MDKPVFISFEHTSSVTAASALYDMLGGTAGTAFIYTKDIADGERIPEAILDALLASSVVVIFPTERYFRSWYCQKELEAALAPIRPPRSILTPGEVESVLMHIVVARPDTGWDDVRRDLPTVLGNVHAPPASDTGRLAGIVRDTLDRCQPLALRLGPERSARLRAQLLGEMALPRGRPTSGFIFPPIFPRSLEESFVGRSGDIWRVHASLYNRGAANTLPHAAVALEGMGGVGKTTLAIEYARRLGDRYPAGVIWIDASVPTGLVDEQLHRVLTLMSSSTTLRIEAYAGRSDRLREDLAVAARNTVESRGSLLVIVDGVPEPDPGRHPASLETWFPALDSVHLLLTSRWAISLGNRDVRGLRLDVLQRPDSILLLTRDINATAMPEAEWDAIADWVGDMPFVLTILNAILVHGALSARQLREQSLRSDPIRPLDAHAEALRLAVPEGSVRGISEALHASFELLAPPERAAAIVIAHLAPSAIPFVLMDAIGGSCADASVRLQLRARSFVYPEGLPTMYGRMHTIIGALLRSTIGGYAVVRDIVGDIGDALYDLLPADAQRVNIDRDALVPLVPHALAALALLGRFEQELWEVRLALALRLGRLLMRLGLADDAREVLEAALESADRIAPPSEYPISVLGSYASALRACGRYAAAIAAGRREVELSAELFGTSDSATVTAKHNLAISYLKVNELHQTAQLLGEVVVERRELPSTDESRLLAEGTLAVVLQRLGDLQTAMELGERVLSAHRTLHGDDHPDTITSTANLGMTFYRIGYSASDPRTKGSALSRASRLLETAERWMVENEGPTHPETLVARNDIAKVRAAQGDLDGARIAFDEIRAIRESTLGAHHGDTLMTINDIGRLLYEAGGFAEAIEVLRPVLLTWPHAERDTPLHATFGVTLLECEVRARIPVERSEGFRHIRWLIARREEELPPDFARIRRHVRTTLGL